MVKINKLLIALALIFAITFAGCSSENNANLAKSNSTDSLVQIQKEDGTKSEVQITQEKLTRIIADGIYTEDISYSSPGGNENFKLTLEINKNMVKNISLETLEATKVGQMKISQVNTQLQTLLVGKSLNEVAIPTIIVSGASLTSKAFNTKLNELKSN